MAATDLVSLAELNSALQEPSDSGIQDERKNAIITQVSAEIEDAVLHRQIVKRGALTEYHTAPECERELYLSEYPLCSGATVTIHEDPAWESKALASRYGADTLLVENTDFVVIQLVSEPAPFVILRRLLTDWAEGYRAIKVEVSSQGCGYTNTGAVPAVIKGVCLEVSARVWRDRKNAEIGVTARSDSMGTVTRQLPALLLEEDIRKLLPYARVDFAPTWERAA